MNNEILPLKKKRHLRDFPGTKEQAAKVDFGTYELKPSRLAKSSGKTENYAIITQGQWDPELEFRNLTAEERNSDLLYYFFRVL